jgi:SAM-dependent methyltransferase
MSAVHTSASGPQPPAGDDAAAVGNLQSILHLEPDTAGHDDGDSDSAFGGQSTASTSLASTILHYEYTNGRRYHGYRSGAYILPNDEQEQDRLDLLHHIFLLILGGKLHDAPLPRPPQRVLDIGTGTGIWAIDFADENHGAEVVGTDLSPIQPTWVPPNVKFYIDDAEAEWVYGADEAFDFIHCRTMSGSISDWDRLVRQTYAHVQPGGWVEFQEPLAQCECDDGTMDMASDLLQWQVLCHGAAKGFGKDIRAGHTLKQRMLDAGFVDAREGGEDPARPLAQGPAHEGNRPLPARAHGHGHRAVHTGSVGQSARLERGRVPRPDCQGGQRHQKQGPPPVYSLLLCAWAQAGERGALRRGCYGSYAHLQRHMSCSLR